MASSEPRVALLAGASGFVGAYVLDSLLDAPDFARVFAITRRPLGREHSRLAGFPITRVNEIVTVIDPLTAYS